MPDWFPSDSQGFPLTQAEALWRLKHGSVSDKVRLHRQLREGLPPASKAEDEETKPRQEEEK